MKDAIFEKLFPFQQARNNQREVIEKIIEAYENGKKYIILNAPTGSGKSAIGLTVARYYTSSYFLTSQKVLQEQYYKDFKIPYVFGKSSYTCMRDSSLTCEFGECIKKYGKQGKCKDCPYINARDLALGSAHSNLNYSFYLKIAKRIPQRNLIVCDESHNLENELIKNATLSLYKDSFKYLNLNGVSYPSNELYPTDRNKKRWLFENFFPRIKNEVSYLQEQLFKNSMFKNTREFKRFAFKYSILCNYYSVCKNLEIQDQSKNGQIIISSNDKCIEFKPLYGNNLFMNILNNCSEKFLFMSATILNKKTFCRDLGIPEHECEYISLNSVFPVENRPIYYKPIGSLAWKDKAKTLPLLASEVDRLLFKYSNVKGIIHTVNYDIAEYIIRSLKNSPNCERLLMPKGDNRTEILKMFYRSTKPLVLISPSLAEGIDLKEDLSRFCIICKVPYSNLANKWVKTRMDENPEWYAINTAETLLQQTGRSIRSESDKADTYILDSAFLQFAKTNGYLLPQWWKDSVIIES